MVALVAALALQASTPPALVHHIVLRFGAHKTLHIHDAHARSWSVVQAGIVSLSNFHWTRKDTTVEVTAMRPGIASIVVRCAAGGEEVWLVDVV